MIPNNRMNEELLKKKKFAAIKTTYNNSSNGSNLVNRPTMTNSNKIGSNSLSDLSQQILLAHSSKKAIDLEGQSYNLYSEFPEFSKKQLDHYMSLFILYDTEGKGKINLEGFKRMMEKLGFPQTHLSKCFIDLLLY